MSKEPQNLFTAKLAHICNTRPITRVAVDRLAGLRDGTIAIWISRGVLPAPYSALKVARALRVDFEWLMDEGDARLDPVSGRTTEQVGQHVMRPNLREASQDELMKELARRYCEKLDILNGMIEAADRAAWEEAAINLWSGDLDSKPDGNNKRLLEAGLSMDIQLDAMALVFSIEHWLMLHREELRQAGAALPEYLVAEDLAAKWRELQHKRPGITALLLLNNYQSMPRIMKSPDAKDWHKAFAVPVVLSHLVTHERVASNPNREGIRAKLRKDGYIGKNGKPTYPLPWEATDEERERMNQEFERQRRKRK